MHYILGITAGVILFAMMVMPAQYYMALVGVAAMIGGAYWCQTDPTRGGICAMAGIILVIIGIIIWRKEAAREQREAEQTAESIRGQMNRPPPGL